MSGARPCLLITIAALIAAGTIIASGTALKSVRGTPAELGGSSHAVSAQRLNVLPSVILWAWDRPEDLRYLAAKRIGVSFLAETVTLGDHVLRVRPRLHPLKVLPDTPLIACARIEIDTKHPPALTAEQLSAVASGLAGLGNLKGISALQVDFDAVRSERALYADLLREIRRQLPPTIPLSITALASWCTGDPWIEGLPIDEAVPMLFRMGPDAEDVRLLSKGGGDFSLAICRESVGLSTDEAIGDFPTGRRRYFFRPQGWSPAAVHAITGEEHQP